MPFPASASFLFQAVRANLVRVYYAFQNTRTPMINGAISIAVNITLSILLSKIFGVGGIALATSIAMLAVSVLLLPGLKKYIPGFNFRSIFPECIKAVGSALIVGIAAYLLRSALSFGAFVSFALVGVFTVLTYVALAYLANIRIIKNSVKYLLGSLWA